MARKRSIIAGTTDYSGYSLGEMIAHLAEWRDSTRDTIARLTEYRKAVETASGELERHFVILEFLDRRIDLFKRILPDLLRLIEELPAGPRPRHVELIQQIVERSQYDDYFCVQFKNEFLNGKQHSELLGNIYTTTREMIIDYLDLANLAQRLRTFLEQESSTSRLSVLELKPNIYGIGVDLKLLFGRLWKLLVKLFRKAG